MNQWRMFLRCIRPSDGMKVNQIKLLPKITDTLTIVYTGFTGYWILELGEIKLVIKYF